MTTTMRRCAALLSAFALLTACDDDEPATTGTTGAGPTTTAEPVIDPGDGGAYAPEIDPTRFADVIDNPYLPLLPGARWVYEETSDGETERIEVTVTAARREVMGVSTVVVRDTVTTTDGQLVEDTYDWFAQDVDGNVWYFGEATAEYEDGEQVSTEGSWEAGVDGALPGIVMPAHPEPGQAYRQEFFEGEAEDLGEVVRTGVTESVPFGAFDDLLVIKEWNPFEPEVVEEKYYAAGVGMVLEVKTEGGSGRGELIEHTPGRQPS